MSRSGWFGGGDGEEWLGGGWDMLIVSKIGEVVKVFVERRVGNEWYGI